MDIRPIRPRPWFAATQQQHQPRMQSAPAQAATFVAPHQQLRPPRLSMTPTRSAGGMERPSPWTAPIAQRLGFFPQLATPLLSLQQRAIQQQRQLQQYQQPSRNYNNNNIPSYLLSLPRPPSSHQPPLRDHPMDCGDNIGQQQQQQQMDNGNETVKISQSCVDCRRRKNAEIFVDDDNKLLADLQENLLKITAERDDLAQQNSELAEANYELVDKKEALVRQCEEHKLAKILLMVEMEGLKRQNRQAQINKVMAKELAVVQQKLAAEAERDALVQGSFDREAKMLALNNELQAMRSQNKELQQSKEQLQSDLDWMMSNKDELVAVEVDKTKRGLHNKVNELQSQVDILTKLLQNEQMARKERLAESLTNQQREQQQTSSKLVAANATDERQTSKRKHSSSREKRHKSEKKKKKEKKKKHAADHDRQHDDLSAWALKLELKEAQRAKEAERAQRKALQEEVDKLRRQLNQQNHEKATLAKRVELLEEAIARAKNEKINKILLINID